MIEGIVSIVFFVVAFIVAMVTKKKLGFYQSFLLWLIVLFGGISFLFPGIGMAFMGKHSYIAELWGYNPVFLTYGLAMLMVSFISFIAIFVKNTVFRATVALQIGIFLIIAEIAHIVQVYSGILPHQFIISIVVNSIVGLTMIIMVIPLIKTR